ncbi:MAG: hypothetical protein U0166_28165 [Acidobacteriota bacterium]
MSFRTIGTVMMLLASPALAQRGNLRERRDEHRTRVVDVRAATERLYASAGPADAKAAAAEARTLWAGLPPGIQSAVEARHPGTTARVNDLEREWEMTHEGNVTRTDDGLSRESSTTGPRGNTTSSEAAWSKDDDGVSRDGSATGPRGGTTESHDAWERDGSTVHHDGETTGPRGGTATRESTRTRTRGESFTPKYQDDLDVFGGRPLARTAGAGGGTRAGAHR